MRSSRTTEGRRAMAAYQRQRLLAFAAPSKLAYVEHLLHHHRHDRVLLFTSDNDAAYELSRRFLVPAITHQTKVTERSAILAGLRRRHDPRAGDLEGAQRGRRRARRPTSRS
jgi:superfamily II DNA or RNA helicase